MSCARLQGLAEAWAQRSVDPWWRKASTAGSGGGAAAEAPSAPLLLAGECPGSPDGEQLVPVAAAALAGVLHQGYRKYGEVRERVFHAICICSYQQQHWSSTPAPQDAGCAWVLSC